MRVYQLKKIFPYIWQAQKMLDRYWRTFQRLFSDVSEKFIESIVVWTTFGSVPGGYTTIIIYLNFNALKPKYTEDV